MISNREMFCSMFGALTMLDYIPVESKRRIMIDMATKIFGLSKEELGTILDELDSTVEFIFKQYVLGKKNEVGV